MENVGPINGANKLKSGKEFVNDLFQSDSDNENGEEEEEEEEEEERQDGLSPNEENNNNQEAKKEKVQFKEDSQKILLNLSKPTLRNIVMLICDEAVKTVLISLTINETIYNRIIQFFRDFYSSKN